MATEEKQQTPALTTEDAKIDLFEDDDEFEEFEIGQGISFFFFFISSLFI